MTATSPITPFYFRSMNFYVKRDEWIDPLLSGNKYRKLYTLLHTPKEHYQTLVSHGGSQSNAMLSIAALCQQKSWKFEYYCRPIAAHLKQQPSGNLQTALALGMHITESTNAQHDAQQRQHEDKTLYIPQGGACSLAEQGIKILAQEIQQWQQQQTFKSLNIITPSGTGTTAYYLAKSLPDCQVITTACIGSVDYLQQQMQLLGSIPHNLHLLAASKRYHFAKPYPEFITLYQELKQAGIEFDLLYAPLMWQSLLENTSSFQGAYLYIHSGGLAGNPSMLERYHHIGFNA